MAKTIYTGGMRFDFSLAPSAKAVARPQSNTPFRMAILGDFSGRMNRGIQQGRGAMTARQPIAVDVDSLEHLPQRLGAQLQLSCTLADGEEGQFELRFASLEDFHPDRLFQQVPRFSRLKLLRQRLEEPATFAAAAQEVRAWSSGEAASKAALAQAASPSAVAATAQEPAAAGDSAAQLGSMLDQLMSRPIKGQSSAPPRTALDVEALIRQIAQPNPVNQPNAGASMLMAAVHQRMGQWMRAILHHPDFQALEATWRGLHFLASRLETNQQLKLFLIDVSKEELAADLLSQQPARETALYHMLAGAGQGAPGAEPWAVLVGDYYFEAGARDAQLISRLAQIAALAGAPFVSGAAPSLVGCQSLAQQSEPQQWHAPAEQDAAARAAWEEFRGHEEAAFIGLACPRFLLRQPYGRGSDPIDSFELIEIESAQEHEHFLWGNPAFAAGYLLAESFSQDGWDLQLGTFLEVDQLPYFAFERDGESAAMPCGEAWLSETAAMALIERGLIPLLSVKGSPAVRVAGLTSLARPVTALAGRWGGG